MKNYTFGDYFGELALIYMTPRFATVVAVEDCKVISIERRMFKRILGPIEAILLRNIVEYERVLKDLNLAPIGVA